MAAHIFAEEEEGAAEIEDGAGVEAAGVFENVLLGAQRLREGVEQAGGELDTILDVEVGAQSVDGLDGCFTAYAATGGSVEVALQLVDIWCDVLRQGYVDHIPIVFRSVVGIGDVLTGGDDAFGEEETFCQLEIVAGGAHGDGYAFLFVAGRGVVANAYLHGLFGGEHIGLFGSVGAGDLFYGCLSERLHEPKLRDICCGITQLFFVGNV